MAPSNDNFADAEDLAGDLSHTVTGTTVDATAEVGEPDQVGGVPAENSVWYHIGTPTESQTFTARLSGGLHSENFDVEPDWSWWFQETPPALPELIDGAFRFGPDYGGIYTRDENRFDFTNGIIEVQVDLDEAYDFEVYTRGVDGRVDVYTYVDSETLVPTLGIWTFSTAGTEEIYIPFDRLTMNYWRVEFSAGIPTIKTSSDGSTWTTQLTGTHTFNMTNAYLSVDGYPDGETIEGRYGYLRYLVAGSPATSTLSAFSGDSLSDLELADEGASVSFDMVPGTDYWLRVSSAYTGGSYTPSEFAFTWSVFTSVHLSSGSSELLYELDNSVNPISQLVFGDGVEVLLYDPTGIELLAVLNLARGVQWQHELSKPGTASFEVPLNDSKTALIRDNCIVKFAYRGRIRFGCVIISESIELATDGTQWLRFEKQPGVASILARSIVYPEYGIGEDSSYVIPDGQKLNDPTAIPPKAPRDRYFGFMSKGDQPWYDAAEWWTPWVLPFTSDTGFRAGHPYAFTINDPNAQWISEGEGQYAEKEPGSAQYFRGVFYVPSDMVVQMYLTGDNFYTVYVNGEKVMDPQYNKPKAYFEADLIPLQLKEGYHLIAAKVENDLGTVEHPKSPIAFIATVLYRSRVTGQPTLAEAVKTLAADVNFALDSAALTAQAKATLDEVVAHMASSSAQVSVVGHASTDGSASHNQWLSEQRAASVKNYLLSKMGGLQITAVGKGETQPAYSPGYSPKNRRVVVTYPYLAAPADPYYEKVSVIYHTDSTWKVHTTSYPEAHPAPGWFRASVLLQLMREAKDRNVMGFNAIQVGFTDAVDSNGEPWTDRGEFVFQIVTSTVLDVATTLSESTMDFDVDAQSMTLNAYNRKGGDRTTGDDAIALWIGNELLSCETSRLPARATTVVGQVEDSSWVEMRDPLGMAATGRIEAGLVLGSVGSNQTGLEILQGLLSEASTPTVQIITEVSTLKGPRLYEDYGLGDSILIPNHRGLGMVRARILSVTVDASGDIVRAFPELVVESTSAVAVAGTGDTLWSISAGIGELLYVTPAARGSVATPLTFQDGSDAYVLSIGSAGEFILTAVSSGAYSSSRPWLMTTADSSKALAVWVEDGHLVTELRSL